MTLSELTREENEKAGRDAAKRVRDKHHLGAAPIADVATLLEEEMGFDVLIAPMPAGVDAMVAAEDQRGRVIIGVATTKNAERQRFSIAHELGHAVFEDLLEGTSTHSVYSEEEDRAHCFARHFLIPVDGMEMRLNELDAVAGELEEEHLSALVQYFGVSAHVAARQLRQAGWIDDERYRQWKDVEARHLAPLYGWDAERATRVATSTTSRTPQRLAARATRAYVAGLVPLQTLAGIRGDKDVSDTRAWLEDAGITVNDAVPAQATVYEGEEI
jgi:Zn-dependent peptidase ImmA (M78 family)